MHTAFHISQLRKYVLDTNHAIVNKLIEATKNLGYEELPSQPYLIWSHLGESLLSN